jgi:hypothetical protein
MPNGSADVELLNMSQLKRRATERQESTHSRRSGLVVLCVIVHRV